MYSKPFSSHDSSRTSPPSSLDKNVNLSQVPGSFWRPLNSNFSTLALCIAFSQQLEFRPTALEKPKIDSKTETAPSLEEDLKPGEVQVFVWKTNFGGLGHVSLRFSGGRYWSLWPKLTAAGGLTAILPLQAVLAHKLEEDFNQEARRPPEDFSNLMSPIEIIPFEPDLVFKFKVDEQKIEQVEKELARLTKGINEGNVRYQLLPGLNTARFYDAFFNSGRSQSKEIYNCVTLSQHLLTIGGIEGVEISPWMTPSKFADQLQQSSSDLQISSFLI